MAVSLEKVKNEELAQVAAMAHTIWRAYYPGIVGSAQTEYMLAKFYTVEAMQHRMEEQGETYYWILDDGEKAGYLAVAPKDDGILFLNKLYVAAGLRGKNIGSAVFPIIEDLYPWFRELRLTVNRKNIGAVNFYFRNGFRIDHAEDFDIDEGYFMEDFVMTRKFVQKPE